ncbi:MAG: (Fe-S)-binding protein [Anaerolineae bacterium]
MPRRGKRECSLTDKLTPLQLISLDACTRCNECLNWCTVLEVTEDLSLTAPEKIRLFGEMIRARHGLLSRVLGPRPLKRESLEKLSEALYTCTTCGRCGEVCEVGIPTQRLWPTLRAKMVELGVGPMEPQRGAPATVEAKHNPYDQPHENRFAWVPGDIPIAEEAKVGYFAGCSGPYTAQVMNIGAVRIIAATGTKFTINRDEWCCGFPLWVLGYQDMLRDLALHNIEAYAQRGVKQLLVSCPCCTDHLAHRWPQIYGKSLPFEIVHITQFAAQKIETGELRFTKPFPRTMTFHDPCYLSRAMRIFEEPRKVIAQFPEVNFLEMEQNRELSKCCGAGGGTRRAFSQMTLDLATNMIHEVEQMGAEVLAVTCPACYERFHLVQEQGLETNLEVKDLMQLASELL